MTQLELPLLLSSGQGREWFIFLFLSLEDVRAFASQINTSWLNRSRQEFALKQKKEERKEGGELSLGSISRLSKQRQLEVPWAEPQG